MTERLRLPFFVVALVCLALAVLLEVGSLLFVHAPNATDKPPGLGIGYMALVDGSLLFTVVLMGLALVLRENLQGRIQGCATLIFSIVIIIAGIVMIFFAIGLLLLMVGLVLAVPFGTIAYLAVWKDFPRGVAAGFLSTIMLLKVVFAVCLPLAEQRFLEMKGLIVMVLLSFVASIVVAFLQGFPPGVLVSITDALAAIVVGIVGVILAVVMLAFAIVAVLRAIQLNRNLAQ